ncbi:cation transporter, partial [Klebsiella pneumoniae]|uniref:heavy-metal-associated domain-containing protein n=1 Tax=Klebsiella pneumoniae TaxID=573 RepID=UPI003A80B5B8
MDVFVFLLACTIVLGLFYPSQEQEAPKNDDAKKDDGVVTFVLEMDCESCAKKVRDAVKDYEGVQPEKTGCHANKVTVVGKVNPVQMKERLEVKMKKTVGLIYPQPKKDE